MILFLNLNLFLTAIESQGLIFTQNYAFMEKLWMKSTAYAMNLSKWWSQLPPRVEILIQLKTQYKNDSLNVPIFTGTQKSFAFENLCFYIVEHWAKKGE